MKTNLKRAHLRTSHTNTETVISEEGEILQQDIQNIKYLASTQEEYFIIYASTIAIMQKDMTQAETKLYAYLLQNYNVGSEIGITKQGRINIGKRLELNERTVLNTLCMLVTRKLIYTINRSIYKLNPRYAYKGSILNRNRALKFVLEVECPTC
jgi:Firmicute plasmid replication protein (RepL)